MGVAAAMRSFKGFNTLLANINSQNAYFFLQINPLQARMTLKNGLGKGPLLVLSPKA